jgi:hypothetical protein
MLCWTPSKSGDLLLLFPRITNISGLQWLPYRDAGRRVCGRVTAAAAQRFGLEAMRQQSSEPEAGLAQAPPSPVLAKY